MDGFAENIAQSSDNRSCNGEFVAFRVKLEVTIN